MLVSTINTINNLPSRLILVITPLILFSNMCSLIEIRSYRWGLVYRSTDIGKFNTAQCHGEYIIVISQDSIGTVATMLKPSV